MKSLVKACLLADLLRVKPEAYVINSDNKEQQKKCLPGIFNSPYLVFRFHFTTKLHKV